MIIDITGTILTPGNLGKDCMGNGQHPEIECCCEECDYMLCCLESRKSSDCIRCTDQNCPNSPGFIERPK